MVLCSMVPEGRGMYVRDVIYKRVYKYTYLSQINETRINSIIKTKFYSPEQVDSLLFLESIVTKKWWRRGRCEEKRRQASGNLIHLCTVWKNENITERTTLRLFNRSVKSFSSYGCETWKVTEPVVREPQVSINRCLRRIVNMSCP
jgi:hypothetical protein